MWGIVIIGIVLLAASLQGKAIEVPAPIGGLMRRTDVNVDGNDVDATPAIQRFAEAVAYAEGYGQVGAIPTRANNPGDLSIPGWTGDTLGDDQISVFDTPSEGWRRLRHQLILIRDGHSQIYDPSWTIAQMAEHYAPRDPVAWSINVAQKLNVTTDVPVSRLLS